MPTSAFRWASVTTPGSRTCPDPSPVLDDIYLRAEADRLHAIAEGRTTTMFSYPGLLRWTPPQTQLDGVGTATGAYALAGLGLLDPIGDPIKSKDACWQWMAFRTGAPGASVLVKRRFEPAPLPAGNTPAARSQTAAAQPRPTTPHHSGPCREGRAGSGFVAA